MTENGRQKERRYSKIVKEKKEGLFKNILWWRNPSSVHPSFPWTSSLSSLDIEAQDKHEMNKTKSIHPKNINNHHRPIIIVTKSNNGRMMNELT